MDVDDEGDYLDDDGMMAVSMLHLVVRGLDETVASRFAEVCHQPSLGSLLYDVCMYLEMYLDLQLNLYFCKFYLSQSQSGCNSLFKI